MNPVHRRLVLLTGASLSTLALAAPACASTVPGIDDRATGQNVDDSLTISAIGDDQVLGVTVEGTSSAVAAVGSSDSGEIDQVGFATGTPPGSGHLVMSATNAGTILIQAIADADNDSGAAQALSYIPIAIDQFGDGRDSSSVALDNNGTLGVHAGAKATGSVANASASLLFGAYQSAIQVTASDGAASVGIDNHGLINLSASALANGGHFASATANVRTAIYQHASAQGGGGASVTLTNEGTIAIGAGAQAAASNGSAATALAFAFARGLHQTAAANKASFTTAGSGAHEGFNSQPDGPASVLLDNSGTFSVGVEIAASAGNRAIAIGGGLGLFQETFGSDASALVNNQGQIEGSAAAKATAGQFAVAVGSAQGMIQLASAERSLSSATASTSALHFRHFKGGAGAADVSLTNSGTISMVASGRAIATDAVPGVSGTGSAIAEGEAGGIGQYALGASADVALDNHGSIIIKSVATATGAQNAFAAARGDGFGQHASAVAGFTSLNFTASGLTGSVQHFFTGEAALKFSNSGILDVEGTASAKGAGVGVALVDELGGVQGARARIATLEFNNSGTFSVSGVANAFGASERARADATGAGQSAEGASSALVSFINSGKITVEGVAHGMAQSGSASNLALAQGLDQAAYSIGTATASIVNSGTVSVDADAKGVTRGIAFARAFARAVAQDPALGTLKSVLDNQGSVQVTANASAIGGQSAFASASAKAYLVDAANVVADITNSGSLAAHAVAIGSGAAGSAAASAIGISIDAVNHFSQTAAAGALGGSLVNAGKIIVSAKVDSKHSGTVTAIASGIHISATRNNLVVTNSGMIDVEAVTGHGGPASASGVRVIASPASLPSRPRDLFTFTNDGGTIIARQSSDDGKSWQRGMAIDVSQASNPSVINLFGKGMIYGNIGVQAGDQLNVEAGTTYFDGVINPSYLPAGGINAAALDSGLAGVGTLNIGSLGNLILGDPRLTTPAAMYDGPSFALLDTLNIASDGTLTLELQPGSSGAQAAGSYSQVFANNANLGGTLVADVTPATGLFGDSYSWDNVIDAKLRSGSFQQCSLGGVHSASVLLKLACTYDPNQNVDLSLTRVHFDQVAGLNRNGSAVGAALEAMYSSSATGSLAQMFGNLFLISEAGRYDAALNQLSGSAYANYLNSLPSLGVYQANLVDEATSCDEAPLLESSLDCRSGPVHVWGEAAYQSRNADGDSEAGASSSKRSAMLIGIDAKLGESLVIGEDAGTITNDLRDDQFGDTVKTNGWTAGAYGLYDPGAFFIKGLASYSSLKGHSTRHVDFAGLASGASFVESPTGRPDANIWTLALHGGARFALGGRSVVKPYLNLDYVNATLDGFTELNGGAAALTVSSSKSSHSFVTAGVKLATTLGSIVPEIDLGYRYGLGNQRSSVNAFLDGDSAASFAFVSSAQNKGSLLAGLNIGGRIGRVDVRIGYEGEFNGRATSHRANFKLVLPLGGHSAPVKAAAAGALSATTRGGS